MKRDPLEFVKMYGRQTGRFSSLANTNFAEVEKRFIAAQPAIAAWHKEIEGKIEMSKKPTTKQLQEERQRATKEANLSKCKRALHLLNSFHSSLSEFAKMGDLLKEIREHEKWLIAESETYQQAAAELFVAKPQNDCATDPRVSGPAYYGDDERL